MKKILENKKVLILTVIALVALVVAIIVAMVINNNHNDEPEYMSAEEEWSTMMLEEGEPSYVAEEEDMNDEFDYSSDEENAEMGNPWFDTTPEELETVLGIKFKLPEGATDDTYRMNLAIGLGEVNFTYDGLTYNARIQNSDEYEDISGVYEEWTVTDQCDVNGAKGEVMRALHSDTDMVDVITWFDDANKHSYSLETSGNLDGFDIEAIAEMMWP